MTRVSAIPDIWGDGTTACAADGKQFGAWGQNLMTEWHIRYGGRGVMIYWHVERKSACIYSQLKRRSSSEVAAMIEGVLRHDGQNVQLGGYWPKLARGSQSRCSFLNLVRHLSAEGEKIGPAPGHYGMTAVDHEVVAVDETAGVAGEKERALRDIVRKSGAGERLQAHKQVSHRVGEPVRFGSEAAARRAPFARQN